MPRLPGWAVPTPSLRTVGQSSVRTPGAVRGDRRACERSASSRAPSPAHRRFEGSGKGRAQTPLCSCPCPRPRRALGTTGLRSWGPTRLNTSRFSVETVHSGLASPLGAHLAGGQGKGLAGSPFGQLPGLGSKAGFVTIGSTSAECGAFAVLLLASSPARPGAPGGMAGSPSCGVAQTGPRHAGTRLHKAGSLRLEWPQQNTPGAACLCRLPAPVLGLPPLCHPCPPGPPPPEKLLQESVCELGPA